MVDAQAQADPWLPPQLDQAVEQLKTQQGRLTGVDDLLQAYRATL
ncbi:hypothetical protein [Amycolatopsis suaedae]|nr:hypothetical protein [Amycolatopsis suaedae]